MSILARITSSTPHTPEAHNVGYLYSLIAVTAFAVVFHQEITPLDFAYALAAVSGVQSAGAVAAGIQRRVQGDKPDPQTQAPA